MKCPVRPPYVKAVFADSKGGLVSNQDVDFSVIGSECMGKKCEWWDEYEATCIVNIIGDALRELGRNLER